MTNVLCGYHLAILRPHPDVILGTYLREILMMDDIHDQFVKRANGVTRYGLTFGSIASTTIPVPPMDHQQLVADVSYWAEREIILQTAYLQKLRQQKRGLMQQLLTGAVRLPQRAAG